MESLIVVNESVETEGLLSNPSSSKPANVNEDEVSTSGSSNSLPERPWPKLNEFFSVHSTRNLSHSNLRKHVQVLAAHYEMLFLNSIRLSINISDPWS